MFGSEGAYKLIILLHVASPCLNMNPFRIIWTIAFHDMIYKYLQKDVLDPVLDLVLNPIFVHPGNHWGLPRRNGKDPNALSQVTGSAFNPYRTFGKR